MGDIIKTDPPPCPLPLPPQSLPYPVRMKAIYTLNRIPAVTFQASTRSPFLSPTRAPINPQGEAPLLP